MVKIKKSEIQFKFLFSLIFGVFLFGFIFLFIVQTFVLYQKYTVYNLYTTVLSMLDILNVKKNTAGVIEITSLKGFQIEFKGDEVSISMFLESQNFPLYNKIIFGLPVETNTIYYDTVAVYFPFYVSTIILVIPINSYGHFLFKTDTNSFIISGKSFDFVDNFYREEINPSFSSDLPFCVDDLTNCLRRENIKKTNIKRILFIYNSSISNDDILFIQALRDSISLMSNRDKYWIIKAKQINDFVYKIEMTDSLVTKEEIENRISSYGRWFFDYTFYVPKELVFASLLVNDERTFEKNLEKLYRNIYYSYISYSQIKEDRVFSLDCEDFYPELVEIKEALKKALNNEGGYSLRNVSLLIAPLVESIKEKNSNLTNLNCVLY